MALWHLYSLNFDSNSSDQLRFRSENFLVKLDQYGAHSGLFYQVANNRPTPPKKEPTHFPPSIYYDFFGRNPFLVNSFIFTLWARSLQPVPGRHLSLAIWHFEATRGNEVGKAEGRPEAVTEHWQKYTLVYTPARYHSNEARYVRFECYWHDNDGTDMCFDDITVDADSPNNP